MSIRFMTNQSLPTSSTHTRIGLIHQIYRRLIRIAIRMPDHHRIRFVGFCARWVKILVILNTRSKNMISRIINNKGWEDTKNSFKFEMRTFWGFQVWPLCIFLVFHLYPINLQSWWINQTRGKWTNQTSWRSTKIIWKQITSTSYLRRPTRSSSSISLRIISYSSSTYDSNRTSDSFSYTPSTS